jgi:hypothetical protein
MKINIAEMKSKIIAVNGNDITGKAKTYGYLKIPVDYLYEPNDIDNSFYSVWYRIENDHIELEYSEDGVRFNTNSDWCIDLYASGKFRGKGSTRHRDIIKNSIDWLIKATHEEKYNHLLLGESP